MGKEYTFITAREVGQLAIGLVLLLILYTIPPYAGYWTRLLNLVAVVVYVFMANRILTPLLDIALCGLEVATVRRVLWTRTGEWFQNRPINRKAIDGAERMSGLLWPAIYKAFFRVTNGAAGYLPIEPSFLELWPCEVLYERNEAYRIADKMPGFLAIGSDRSEEIFLLKLGENAAPVFRISSDSVGIGRVLPVTDSFVQLLRMIGHES